jgi:hypothetical protein
MRNLCLSIAQLLVSFTLFGQEFTEPDSLAIIKNRVQSVKIYYTGTGSTRFFTKEYRYDKMGHKVFEQEGNAGYYYQHIYNDRNQVKRSVQRLNNGTFVQGWDITYHSNNVMKELKYYNEKDTVFPQNITGFDSAGNKASEILYVDRKPTHFYTYRFNSKNECVYIYDSIPGNGASERVNSNLTRISYYDDKHEYGTTWLFSYDSLRRLSKAVLRVPKKKEDVYTIVYGEMNAYEIRLNGSALAPKERTEFENQFGYLLPRYDEEFGLPISDPVDKTPAKHTLKKDNRGNIIEDTIHPPGPWGNQDIVYFTYEYTFYK